MKPTGFATIETGRALIGPLPTSQVPRAPCALRPLSQCDPDHQGLLLRLQGQAPASCRSFLPGRGNSGAQHISLIGDVLEIGKTGGEFNDASRLFRGMLTLTVPLPRGRPALCTRLWTSPASMRAVTLTRRPSATSATTCRCRTS